MLLWENSDNKHIMKMTNLTIPVFDQLYAEHEALWLADAFVTTEALARIANMRSVIVSGDQGAGKSALAHMLIHQTSESVDQTIWIVPWQPVYVSDTSQRTSAAQKYVEQILLACTSTFLQEIGSTPDTFSKSPAWIQELLRWFLHRYAPVNIEFSLSRLRPEITDAGYRLLHHLFSSEPSELYHDYVSEKQVISDLMNALQTIGVDGLWIIVDGLESWLEIDSTQLERH
ncbi:MAG: hypothetical protein R2932_19090 [Caldilineaceae bacterium]